MKKSPRAELLAIQKKLWRRNKEMIEDSVLVKEPDFASYESAYLKSVRKFQRVSSEGEMMDAVFAVDIVYVGDYHTCNQSQRSFLRILKAAVKRDKNFAVGMELMHSRHQKILDDYFLGRMSEEAFLKKIRLKEHWVFDLWNNFKPIFDFCRYHRIPMYAVDSARDGSKVRARDKATAQCIARILQKEPNKRLFILIGDLHIAPAHLPKDVEEVLAQRGVKKKKLMLFENSESIYWQLASDGAEDFVEIVRISDDKFCRMHTPPVVAQRSYLNWLEHDEGEIDYADAKSSFLELVDRICNFLKLDIAGAREEVEVFTCGDLSFLKYLKNRGDFSKHEIATIKKQILASESYYISKAKIVYLANLSLNHAAEEAAHFIKHVCSGDERPRELVSAFYANVLHEALGFFGSKLINGKRKCSHGTDFKNLLDYFKTVRVPKCRKLEYETAKTVYWLIQMERKDKGLSRTDVFRARMDLFLSVTHALGYIMGDRLYYGLIERKISKALIRQLFLDPWPFDEDPVDTYMMLLHKLKKVKIPKRM